MNTFNCTAGYFTDAILLYSNPSVCQQSIAVWLTVSTVCCALRLLLVVPHVVNIQRKTAHRSAITANHGKTQKLSSRSLVRIWTEVMCAVTQAMFILLVSLDVASTRNGLSPMLFGLCLLPVAVSETMDFRVIHRLAKRIIPFRSVGSSAGNIAVTTTLKSRFDDLTKSTDHIIRFGIVVSYAALLLSELSLLVFAPLYANQAWPLQAGLTYMGIYCVCTGMVSGWQLHRCLSAVQSLKVKDDAGIRAAIRKFQYLRALCAIYSIYTAVFIALVVCELIPLYWYVLIIAFFGGELCIQAAFLFTTFARRGAASSSSTPRAPSMMKSRTPVAGGGMELERV